MISDHRIGRRDFLRLAQAGVLGAAASPWLPRLATASAASTAKPQRHCVLLWMSGGPSQMDTFDLKPGHKNGGEFQETATSVPGLRISEHLPLLAKQAEHLAILRGLNTREGDHGRGTYLMRTGQTPGGPLEYPAIGCSLSKELGDADAELPNYISIAANTAFNPAAFSPGFLGPGYAAATVSGAEPPPPGDDQPTAYAQLGVNFLERAENISLPQQDRRLSLWKDLQANYLDRRPTSNVTAQDTIYRRAITMMRSKARDAFDLSKEPAAVRDAYGPGRFGQGCLMARRLIERGVPFVEVALGDGAAWDTHQDNFRQVRSLSQQLDAGWSSLMRELKERGLLEHTTILWMGEFGRTPQINPNGGRDHFPQAWSCVLAGGGVRGGQAYGATSPDGMEVVEGKVSQHDVLATLCQAVGVEPSLENQTAVGRPIRIAEGVPIRSVLS